MIRTVAFRLVSVLMIVAWLGTVLPCQLVPAKDEGADSWGKPVDGLTCRLVANGQYVVGQAITLRVEVKNVSAKTRYVVPQLNPRMTDSVGLEILGPKGQKLGQTSSAKEGLGPKSYQPLGAGEIRRFEVTDLRDNFHDLHIVPNQRQDAPVGKFTLTCRFRSPRVPPRFAVGQGLVDGKIQTIYQDAAAELLAGQWASEVISPQISFEIKPLGPDDLVVHEWGVFTVFNEAKYANLNRRAEWGSLPDFFYRQFPKERLRWVPSAWDKPIVYFYAKPTPLNVSVQVKFTAGAPVVWWPAAADPVDDSPGGRLAKKVRPFTTLSWQAWIGAEVPRDRLPYRAAEQTFVKATDFPLPADCWLQSARLPAASQLSVIGTDPSKAPSRPGAPDRVETERFLYYDGLVPAPDYLRCERIGVRALTLRNRASFDVSQLFVIDRRDPRAVGFAYVDGKKELFKAGTALSIEPKPIAANEWPATGSKQVREALRQAGLFDAEAASLLQIWQRSLLEADGVTVFHILPGKEYERMLPLQIVPAPADNPVRVGIALHPHMEIEPELAARVALLIRQLDDQKFEIRAAASKQLLEIGPMAIAMLRAELKKGPPLEVRTRIEEVLERVDAAEWLKVQGTKANEN
jgi:hypothetical protein